MLYINRWGPATAEGVMDIYREIARPFEDWHEDDGDVVWWYFRDGKVQEAPYIGHPNCLGHTVEVEVRTISTSETHRHMVGGWPGYHTHWTPLPPVPRLPAKP